MYKIICQYGCVTPATNQPKSFMNEENYNKHIKQMHKDKIVQHPIRDLNQEIDDLSRQVEELKIANETLQSQLKAQSQNPSNVDLRTITKIVKKKNSKKNNENEFNKKMNEDEDDEKKKDDNKNLT